MDNDSDLAAAWQRVVEELQPNQQAWVQASEPVTLHGNTAIIAVGRRLHPHPARGPAARPARGRADRGFGREIRLAVTVNPALDRGAAPADTRRRRVDESIRSICRQIDLSPVDLAGAPHETPSGAAPGETRLNPKYTFETFVIGSSNRFPHAAAVAVAEAPGKAYNPLLVYGDSGLGKTHLLHAIGHYVRSLYNGARVRYVSSEEFTNEFINAIRDDRQDRFKRRYRDVDVLLIDDIQFLEGKTQTQEEFFHTFNTLHNANKQIVLTSDRRAQAARGARGPAAQPVRVGPDHRRAAARPRDPDRDPAQEGRDGPAHRAAGRARVHRQQDPDQHPRARGCADPGHRVRQPQPPGGRPDPGRDRAQGPDPRGRRAGDHRGPDHRPDRGVLRALDRRALAARAAAGTWSLARQIAMYLCRELTDLSLPKIGAAVRQPRPHHGDVRRPQDQPAARRAAQRSSTRSAS